MKDVLKSILLCLLLIAMCTTICSCATEITIPDLENLDVSTAKTLLASKGLIPKIVYGYNDDYSYDMVIRTAPPSGSKVEKDSVVTLYVCKSLPKITIPNVVNLDINTAKTLIANKGLIPKVEYEYNNNYDYDLVIRTVPAIGSKVEKDTVITLYVCKSLPKITIPDIESLDINTAKALIASKGLIPKVEYEYNNDYDYDLVIRTIPAIGSAVEEDSPVTLYVCKGPKYYRLPHSVGYMKNVDGIDAFSWGDNGQRVTKGFYNPYVQEGYLYISMYLCCRSEYNIEFYGDFGTASINDNFDKTVPIKVIYEDNKVDNYGSKTEFEVKIPLSDLGVQKPTNIYIEFDFVVNGERETFEAGFDLTW